MKKIMIGMLIVVLVVGTGKKAFASDWDVAGKVFAGLEGLRILSGGNIDPIGTFTGINKNPRGIRDRKHHQYHYAKNRSCCRECVWVPSYIWKKKFVSSHREYSEKYGEIIVEGHYIRYKVEDGGHWESDCEY